MYHAACILVLPSLALSKSSFTLLPSSDMFMARGVARCGLIWSQLNNWEWHKNGVLGRPVVARMSWQKRRKSCDWSNMTDKQNSWNLKTGLRMIQGILQILTAPLKKPVRCGKSLFYGALQADAKGVPQGPRQIGCSLIQ